MKEDFFLVFEALKIARVAFDEYNGDRYKEILERVKHNIRLTQAEKNDLHAYIERAKNYAG